MQIYHAQCNRHLWTIGAPGYFNGCTPKLDDWPTASTEYCGEEEKKNFKKKKEEEDNEDDKEKKKQNKKKKRKCAEWT